MKMKHTVLFFGMALAFGNAWAQQEFTATLKGHAVLKADATLTAPKDAPVDLQTSGKYTTGKKMTALGAVPGKSADRPTGHHLPIQGQPLQGHSGIQVMPDGTMWIVTDNGFGSKANSSDSMLYANRYRIDWEKGDYHPLETVFLSDPDNKVPFRIVHELTPERYLTGSDFDLESMQVIDDSLWFGEEFGPYLIKTNKKGQVQAVFETEIEEKPVRSPDHYAVQSPGAPDTTYTNVNVKRSKGFEGMAASKDGAFLYPMLEGPLWDQNTSSWEQKDQRTVLRILEFDVAKERWTGRYWDYPLEAAHHAIGDFNMIDENTALVIERDNGEGTPDKACQPNQDTTTCFSQLPEFKRVYKIAFTPDMAGGAVQKIGYIDLLAIQDPQQLARKPLTDGVLQFPFFTIENVDVVDAKHIVVGNDNNYPFSSSREPNQQDDNELVLLEVADFLKAKP